MHSLMYDTEVPHIVEELWPVADLGRSGLSTLDSLQISLAKTSSQASQPLREQLAVA